MRKLLSKVSLLLVGFSGVVMAQQDPQFTQFMNNKLMYNAGYAGNSGNICGVLHFRQQWTSFTGAPQSFALTGDMRLSPDSPLGFGLNVMMDKIGPMQTLFLRVPVAFQMPNIGGGTLGFGIDLGVLQKQINENWLPPDVGLPDGTIPGAGDWGNNPNLSKLTYDVGFGAYYSIPKKFYAGISSTHLPAQLLKTGDSVQYKLTRHFYVMAGVPLQINPYNVITPQIMMRSDINATVLDVNVTYMWTERLLVGLTYRHTDAVAPMFGWQQQLQRGTIIKAMYSYDYTLSKIKGYSGGSHEITIGVCHPMTKKKMTSYGDERFLN